MRPAPLEDAELRGRLPVTLTDLEIEALSPAGHVEREAAWRAFADSIFGVAFDREAEWEADTSANETRFNAQLHLSADANRCSRAARRAN